MNTMNKKVIIVVIVVVVIGGGIFFWLQRESSEKAIESSIEKATGGQVDVDIDDGSVKINTNEGSMEIGEGVSLPSGFPSDVHVIDGTIMAATTVTEGEVYTVSIETSKSVTAVKTEYESELEKDGWTIVASLTFQSGASISAEKDDRTVSVTVGDSDGTTMVTIGTSKNE